jgi:phage/conjugal plasmid C-4 type zinc finger TraR family protein
MAGGWAKDGAVQEQIDASIDDAVKRVRSELTGRDNEQESATNCEECDQPIPEARRRAIPGVQLCIACQSAAEQQKTRSAGMNRRGSKDSQLR